MRLPDFHQAVEFERLRELMGVMEIVRLSEVGWRDWEGAGVDVEIDKVQVQPDGRLSFEGRRVLVYIRDQYPPREDGEVGYRFHVADCRKLQDMREKDRYGRYVVTQRRDGRFLVNYIESGSKERLRSGLELELKVCRYCLYALDWRSYRREKKTGRMRIWKAFSPEKFFEKYSSLVSPLPVHDEFSSPLNVYPENWDHISVELRRKRKWMCEGCSLRFEDPPNRRFLHVHHIDGNRANNAESNLRVLCIGCHAKEPDHDHLRNANEYYAYLRWIARLEKP